MKSIKERERKTTQPNMGVVDIIMPVYNSASTVLSSVSSILRQTYPHFHIIMVDDCSIDDSIQIIRSINDKRISIYELKVHSGAAAARNFAMRHCVHKWVAFLDADDQWYPEKLEKQIAFMVQNNHLFSYTAYLETKANKPISKITGPKCISRRRMLSCDYLGCLTVMFNRKLIGSVFIDPRLKKRNDYAIWLEVSKKAKCYFYPFTLARYTVNEKSLSKGSKWSLLSSHYFLFRYQEGFGTVKSFFFMIRNAFLTQFYKKIKYRSRINVDFS